MAGDGRPMLAVPGRRGRRLSEALRLRVRGDVPPGPGGLLGLELEFSVRSVRGGQVHFGSLIHRLPLDGTENRSEERRVGKECRSRWSPYH